MELSSCRANFCAAKIAAVVMHVMYIYCHLHEGKCGLVGTETRGMVTIFGPVWSFSSVEVLMSLIPVGAAALV